MLGEFHGQSILQVHKLLKTDGSSLACFPSRELSLHNLLNLVYTGYMSTFDCLFCSIFKVFTHFFFFFFFFAKDCI